MVSEVCQATGIKNKNELSQMPYRNKQSDLYRPCLADQAFVANNGSKTAKRIVYRRHNEIRVGERERGTCVPFVLRYTTDSL